MAKKGHIHTTHQNMPCGRAVPWEFQEMMCFLEHYAMMWLQSVLGIGFPLLAERGDLYLYLGCRAVAVSVVSKPLATGRTCSVLLLWRTEVTAVASPAQGWQDRVPWLLFP